MRNILKSLFILFIFIVPANAACDFMINIGDKGTKIFEKIAPPMPMFEGQFMLPVQAPEVCPNDNLNDMIAVEYVFLGETEETANLAVFLASDESSFCNGAVYMADGGFTAA